MTTRLDFRLSRLEKIAAPRRTIADLLATRVGAPIDEDSAPVVGLAEYLARRSERLADVGE